MKHIVALAILIIIALAAPSHATDLYFGGDVDTNWETAGNWWLDAGKSSAAGRIPASGEFAFAATGYASYVVINSNLNMGAGGCCLPFWLAAGYTISGGTWAAAMDGDATAAVSAGTFVVTRGNADMSANVSGGTWTTSSQFEFGTGTISGGTFDMTDSCFDTTTVTAGTFTLNSGCQIVSTCTFSGGTFTLTSRLYNYGVINGGTWSGGTLWSTDGYEISGGTFNNVDVTVKSQTIVDLGISGGTFDANGSVTVEGGNYGSSGLIAGGTFRCPITFLGIPTQPTKVTGGTFYGAITGIPNDATGGVSLGGANSGGSSLKWYPKSDIVGSGLF